MNMHMKFGRSAIALALASLAGCGGGGAEGAGSSANGLQEGVDTARQANAAGEAANIVVRASGSLSSNVGPLMEVRVNGAVVASAEVRATAYQSYSFTVPAIAAGAKVDLVFNNDLMNNTGDRNLFVESVTINGATIAANASGVTFDRGPGAQAFDGQDVLAGLSTLWWNGALRFTAPVGPTAPVASSLSPACAGFYAARPGFALDSSQQDATTLPALAKPAKGVAVAEPHFKTCLVRATDYAADGLKGFAWNGYARRQAFNADGSLYLAYQVDGFWNVYDAKTHAVVKRLAGLASDNAEPQWNPTDPKLLNYFPTNGVGMQFHELNVSTNTTRLAADWSARLKAKWPNAMSAWTRGEGSPSRDGRYWCLLVDDNQFGGGGVVTWDRDTDTFLGMLDLRGTASARPDHVSMSPSGNYCVVSHENRAVGTLVYTRDLKNPRKILNGSQHSDIAVDVNGDDVFVTAAYSDSVGTDGDVSMTNLRTGERTVLFNSYGNGGGYENGMHISGKAFNKPGWVVVSTYGGVNSKTYAGTRPWFHEKVFIMQLKANPTILNLADNRSPSGAEKLYWAEPSVNVNRDLTKVYFNSNWGSGLDTGGDTYMVEIPAGAVKEVATTTPPVVPPITPPTKPPEPSALTLTLGTVTRAGYNAGFSLTTSEAAKCRLTWTAGSSYGVLYDDLATNAQGLAHTKSVVLSAPTGAFTAYAVCKANASLAEKEVAVVFN